jgi:2-dehydro-3-deoxyphosphogluconate aldolase/(4S)-4-hydroxy-2-oxoglutarate aldolase
MRGLDLGLSHFKFFPAEASGGLPALKALSAPFAQASFCPTGGISLETAPLWLAHAPVLFGGAKVPAGHRLQGVVASLSLSDVPEGHANNEHDPR